MEEATQGLLTISSTDWSKCALCQEETREKLQCPAISKHKDQGSTYTTLAANITKFHELNALPAGLLNRLEEGGGIEEAFRKRKACFHISCRLKYNSTKLKRKAAALCSIKSESTEVEECDKKFTRRVLETNGSKNDKNQCFICDESAPAKKLRNASTFQLDEKVRKCAIILQDSKLLAKLSAGDVISHELKYHHVCLIALYRKAQPKVDSNEVQTDQIQHGIVFAELTEYMQEVREKASGDHLTVFKLAELAKLYKERLQDYGTECVKVHTGRLKTRLLAHIPDLQAHNSGRDVLLTFSDDLKSKLNESYAESFDDEAVHLAKAARIVRRDLFHMQTRFTESFDEHCQYSSVPETLLALMQMILQGPSIDTINRGKSQASLSLAQLASFNAVKTEGRRSRQNITATKHSKDREPPLPIYIGMMVHALTRKKELVDRMHNLGLSVSYFRVLEISTELARKACQQFKADNVVCPKKLKFGLFTTAAIDNIDHNPSSTTAKDSFHGTAISLFQHPTKSQSGIERTYTDETDSVTRCGLTVTELPEFYTNVPPFVLKIPIEPPRIIPALYDVDDKFQAAGEDNLYVDITDLAVHERAPILSNFVNTDSVVEVIPPGVMGSSELYSRAVGIEHRWMEALHAHEITDSTDSNSCSWGAYHADQLHMTDGRDQTPGISSLLPLFHEESKSPAMIKHAMDLVISAVCFLNSGQTPVIALDQPLFAIAKQIQWQCPDLYGEQRITLLLGGLHTEMAFLKAIGTLLRDSGWTDVLVNAKIASSGVADSFLSASHVTRTRHAHQITVCSLHKLMTLAYEHYLLSCTLAEEMAMPVEEWKLSMMQTSPTFHFWALIMQLELLLLIFISSLREGNFNLYIDSLTKIAPWFFALDQQNYARWLTVHIKDMEELQAGKSPGLVEFEKGHFVFQKSKRPFSKMALDQAHEQNNALIKGDGGAVGLTDNPSALRRWMISGPEVSQVIEEFEMAFQISSNSSEEHHHEQNKSFQDTFKADVALLTAIIQETGNPFLDGSKDFVTLHNDNIVDAAVHDSLKKLHIVGFNQYADFVSDRLIKQKFKISDPIKRNNLLMISGSKRKRKTMKSYQISSLKSDCNLFSRLYIACQTRSGGLDDFFMYENQPTPTSLAIDGNLRSTTKSLLLECLEPLAQPVDILPNVDVMILDGAAIVNMIRPGASRTIGSYLADVFLPYIKKSLLTVKRLDIVWDIYRTDSLKACVRDSRGQGICKKVTTETKIPAQWSSFLRVDANKTKCFQILADGVMTIGTEKLIITTQGPIVLTNHPIDISDLSPCSHEEADTRMMVHLAHSAKDHNKIMIRTVDTDVVVLAVAAASRRPGLELWIAMGTGQNFRYIAAHQIACAMGPDNAGCLPMFHCITGCDTVSSFNGVGKKKAWEVWQACNEFTETFQTLSTPPFDLSVNDRKVLERFVVLMYDKTSNFIDVNSARKDLFIKKGRQINNIPPTSEALLQHFKRAVYQGGHIWNQAENSTPILPNPSDWGWQFCDGKWQPFWTNLPQASSTCQELLKCGCKKGCKSKRCKCHKAGLLCTALCKCSDDCASKVISK